MKAAAVDAAVAAAKHANAHAAAKAATAAADTEATVTPCILIIANKETAKTQLLSLSQAQIAMGYYTNRLALCYNANANLWSLRSYAIILIISRSYYESSLSAFSKLAFI
jgi:hypothetical protein